VNLKVYIDKCIYIHICIHVLVCISTHINAHALPFLFRNTNIGVDLNRGFLTTSAKRAKLS
jgi:hypothetical protein